MVQCCSAHHPNQKVQKCRVTICNASQDVFSYLYAVAVIVGLRLLASRLRWGQKMARCGKCSICGAVKHQYNYTTCRTRTGLNAAAFSSGSETEGRTISEATHDSGEEARGRHRSAAGSRRRKAAEGAEADLHFVVLAPTPRAAQ